MNKDLTVEMCIRDSLQTIPAVAAEEGNGQADALSLSQDLTHFLIVVGAEHHLGAVSYTHLPLTAAASPTTAAPRTMTTGI